MTYGCMLQVCAGDDKTGPNQCSSLITARLHGLIQHQNESTYFKSSTADKPRKFSGGAPLLPGWQEGAGQVPRPTVMVRGLHLDLREAIPKTIPKSQAEESKPEVELPTYPAANQSTSTVYTIYGRRGTRNYQC